MASNFLNSAFSVLLGVVSAVGTTWYLQSGQNAIQDDAEGETVKIKRLEVETLEVTDNLALVNPNTNEATLEIRDGSIYAQNALYADRVGAYQLMGQKVQTTPDDPTSDQAGAFAELGVSAQGGAYLALLSPHEKHSVTLGFDKNEKGFLASKNNNDQSMVAQAVFDCPVREENIMRANPNRVLNADARDANHATTRR
ncbi:MAG: hypothetical protein Q4G03_12335 [Planctomycetia bacterium]|nr:hypothetical protein [Planctomycetia bacterium]